MNKRIVVTGATGLVGRKLVNALTLRNNKVYIVSRSPEKIKTVLPKAAGAVSWDDENELVHQIELCDSIIHLSGENVMSQKWTDEHKKNVLDSRINTTKKLVDAIASTPSRPDSFINASAVGYYGLGNKINLTEDSPPGNNFLADVTKRWENEAVKVEPLLVRQVSLRIGIVLSTEGGALERMITPFKYFVGGPLGSGKQWFPWIHIDDLVNLFLFALNNENVSGPINAVAPESINMKEFCKKMGKVMHRPSLFKVPAPVLKFMFGEGADVILSGNNIIPKKALELGYEFEFDNTSAALNDLLKS